MRTLLIAGAAVAALLAGASAAQADTITSLYDTGVDASHAVLPNGAPELHYDLVAPGIVYDLRTATSANGYPIGPWLGDDAFSDWIGPATDGALNGDPGTYVYRTTFDLTGLNFLTAAIGGLWATDDPGVDILINGLSTGAVSGGYSGWTPFTITAGFLPGVNTLDFVVVNGGGPTGLRVEMSGTAAALPGPGPGIPEPQTWALMLLGFGGLGAGLRAARRREAAAAA